MIDRDGYRLNIGIILVNKAGKLFWGQRIKAHGWQFPQGGVDNYETIKDTMYRELTEELGLTAADVEILATTKRWLHYRLPQHMQRRTSLPTCIGQKQRWFLLLLTAADEKINLRANKNPEFYSWRWVDYWLPLKEIIYFKREVYRRILTEFEPIVQKLQQPSQLSNIEEQ